MDIRPVILSGNFVRLEPLSMAHLPELAAAGSDPEIWRFMRYDLVTTPERMRDFIASLLSLQAKGTDLPFATLAVPAGQPVGMTRFMDIQPENRTLEIGGTWISPAWQRTSVNTEAKFLMLRHAFEVLGCVRVQFKTDLRNTRSQRAIERIGAVREGVLREHMILPDGFRRSSVYYSILASEWPGVCQRLLGLLAEPKS
jgi:N-acetyltransferase